jgi:superfamily II DNA helicase RecQ
MSTASNESTAVQLSADGSSSTPAPAPQGQATTERYLKRLAWRFEEARRLTGLTPAGRQTYERLAMGRGRLARDAGVPAYMVLTNRLLLDLAEARPADEEALKACPGFGQWRFKTFGSELLAILRLGDSPAASPTAALS